MVEATKSDKTRQLSQEQMNSIEHLLQGKSGRAVAEAVGVTRQTIWEWRNHDVLFIAELNRQRSEYNLTGGRDDSGPLSGGGCGGAARLPPILPPSSVSPRP